MLYIDNAALQRLAAAAGREIEFTQRGTKAVFTILKDGAVIAECATLLGTYRWLRTAQDAAADARFRALCERAAAHGAGKTTEEDTHDA